MSIDPSRRSICRWTLAAPFLLAASPPPLPVRAVVEERFIPLGGVDQWVGVRGDDRENPILLLVHGGPGDVLWPYVDKFRAWESLFTVALWDQRGAGRSYGHGGGDKTPDVRLARIVEDGVGLADDLRRRFGKRKIILLGHSWGSAVGVGMIRARPDLFAAYVGTGQIESWKGSVNFQFDLLLARARAIGDSIMIKELEAIGRPDPADTRQYFRFTRNFRTAMPAPDQGWLQSLRPLFQSHRGEKDYDDAEAGMGFSGRSLLPDQIAEDLTATAATVDAAFFVIQGADDVITPTKLAIDYYDRVKAPYKKLDLIPNAGHFAFLTGPDAFLSTLVRAVRPVAIARGA
jgi:pimeloyl-ACP methyl ester carboxylesterase